MPHHYSSRLYPSIIGSRLYPRCSENNHYLHSFERLPHFNSTMQGMPWCFGRIHHISLIIHRQQLRISPYQIISRIYLLFSVIICDQHFNAMRRYQTCLTFNVTRKTTYIQTCNHPPVLFHSFFISVCFLAFLFFPLFISLFKITIVNVTYFVRSFATFNLCSVWMGNYFVHVIAAHEQHWLIPRFGCC